MRTAGETNAINRVLKARGLGSLGDPGVVAALAGIVENHAHLTEMLRACEPELRRGMYEAMKPYLRFEAGPLEDYVIAAKEHAAAAELPVMDPAGNLHPYIIPSLGVAGTSQYTSEQVWVTCGKCGKGALFVGERRADAISTLRNDGWAWDEFGSYHLCPECLDAVDAKAG